MSCAHALGGGGGERHDRHVRERGSRSSASWRYSGRKSWPHSLMQCASSMARSRDVPTLQILRGNRQASGAPARRRAAGIRRCASRAGVGAIRRPSSEELRNVAGTPPACKRIHLVLHQRDERRDDDRQPRSRQRGQLEAERLAAAGRQQREDILARQRVADDLLLQADGRR